MKKPQLLGRLLLAIMLLAGWAPAAWAQSPVTVSPSYFTADTPITLTYDATLGNAGLANYTGDVFIWTGLITDKSTDDTNWHFVVGKSFSAPVAAEKMTALGNHKYSITFTPRTYYPDFATSGEVLKKLAMVFRGTGGSPEGKGVGNSNILVVPGVQVSITSPATPNTVVAAGTSLAVTGTATVASNMTLTLNGTQVAQQTNTTAFSANVTISQQGVNTLVLTASDGSTTASATTTVIVAPPVTTAALPAGAKADGITYLANGTSAILTLTAPNKSYVYVLGEFNNWQTSAAGLMNKTSTVNSDPATGRWWVQVDGLTPGREYAYQFLVDGQLRIADPYCEKILDSDNDKYINTNDYTVYPGLKAYPTGSTTGIVSVLQTGQTPYVWKTTNFKRPARTDMVVYELLLRDFVKRHDYKTLQDTLNYIQRLGVNTIELMPVTEFDGNDNWGYSPCFYFAPDKYYGTKDALKALIDACHSRGMAVVLDMVLNHSTGNSPMVQLYGTISGGPTADNPWFNVVAKHPANVYNDLNHESPYTRYWSKNVMKFWLQEYHVDGYRFDLSKGFTQVMTNTYDDWAKYDASRVAIWQDYYNTLVATDATMYPILEHFAANDEDKALSNIGFMLWGNQNTNYTQAAMGYDTNWDLSYGYYGNQGGRGWSQPNLMTYMESHDEERMQFKNVAYGKTSRDASYTTKDPATGLKRDAMSAALFFSQPGPRMIWQFGELGYDYSINTCTDGTTVKEDCRTAAKPIRWDYQQDANRRSLYNTYKAMALLKRQAVFSAPTSYTQNLGGAVKTISIANADLAVVTYGNFDVETQNATITFPSTGTWYNYLTGTTLNVTSTSMAMALQPGDYGVYTSRRLAVVNPLATRAQQTASFQLSLVPNPAAGTTTVAYQLPAAATASIAVQNLLGQTVRQLAPARQAAGAQAQALPLQGLAPGVYLVRLQADELTQTTRLLVQ
jgi:glycosidase